MAVQTQRYTVEEFDRLVELPENADRLFEYIGGEIIEVPSNPYTSQIAARISHLISSTLDHNDLGHITGEAGGYRVLGERYAPDVAFISRRKQPALAHQGYNPNPPDLAVEVPSPSNDPGDLRIKVVNFVTAGTVIWLVRPEQKIVEVYIPGQPGQKVGIGGVLDGGSVLPGFRLPVNEIFPD